MVAWEEQVLRARLVLTDQNKGVLKGAMRWKGERQLIRFVTKSAGKLQAKCFPDSTLQIHVGLYADSDDNNDGLPDRVDGHERGEKGKEAHVNCDVHAGETYLVEITSKADPGHGTYELKVGRPPPNATE